ncbi:thiolase family protein [Roseiarcaceae bacterium H3SJ34-1]|uniref:thiolase family protein n=1 Tax=Terripilifer ovatus TaxID=3032367 RepID=UPI003AB9ABB0|nr:thiolase family protein [Roseiarcaceae bacterium H3SJ34-1]
MSGAWIVAARRTPVAPRNGAFRSLGVEALAAPALQMVLRDSGISAQEVDEIILGNALYGGGNPARLAALAAGIPETKPALTLDTQCCSGLDAIAAAADRIASGACDIVLAGGIESYSRSPLRFTRPLQANEAAQEYQRPPFAPWPERDPDMIEAAVLLAQELGLTRAAQETYAVESHRKAMQAQEASRNEIVPLEGISADAFTRRLSKTACARLPAISGQGVYAATAATVAVEADAAAIVLVVSDKRRVAMNSTPQPIRIVGSIRVAGDPVRPGLLTTTAAQALLARHGLNTSQIVVAEIMEAFAAQAMASITAPGLDPACVNRGGGALSRGHPIGASGAILAVRLFHELQRERNGFGLATIAAAGGLGSALLLVR